MKAVILAGGIGSRLSELTATRPKALVEVGRRPILWHIMKIYGAAGINEFIICLGHHSHAIKQYFLDFNSYNCDFTVNLKNNSIEILHNKAEEWKVTLIDTGLDTQTGGRIRRVEDYISDEVFCLTYGDSVVDIDVRAVIDFHLSHGKMATVTAVTPKGRFAALKTKGDLVLAFEEKVNRDDEWISGGFFVLQPEVFRLIEGDDTVWEKGPMASLAQQGQLACYKHPGFWHPMDTLRDVSDLEEIWQSGRAPWKMWD